MFRSLVLIALTLNVALVSPSAGAQGDPPQGQVESSTPLPMLEREPRARELIAYPIDKTKAGVNPPGFCWTPHDDAKTYRLRVTSASDLDRPVLSVDSLKSTVYPPTVVFPAGQYRWQVIYQNIQGQDIGVSRTRSFTVSDDLPHLPMPDVKILHKNLGSVRPRLYLTDGRIQRIQQAVNRQELPAWHFFISAADAALSEGPYAEPDGYPAGGFTAEDWQRIFTPAKVGSAHLCRTALAYKITGDRKYLEGARRWMMNLADWDPKGVVSHDVPQPDGSEGNDEGSMPILERMAFAWDWIGDELTPKERAKVLSVMSERGNQVLRKLKKQDFLSHPFENHEGRVLAFLGNAGLAFLGDIPEAEEWLDYVLQCYLTSFPAWGGDNGGWAQGMSYWGGYVFWLSTFAESLRGVTDVDILRRPFYRQNGYFPLYFHPPYAPPGGFGDTGNGKPSLHEKMLIDFWAETFRDPLLKWHANSIDAPLTWNPKSQFEDRGWKEWHLEDVFSVLRTHSSSLKPQPPQNGPVSRVDRNIGWATMHSNFGDAENDVWVLFKSSRFGSFSHSHADQNTFQLNAYGEALAIDSGYYPWYGSPHHVLWTRQTRAHNGILVNQRGQPPFNWDAAGTIEHFEDHDGIVVVRGEAAKAYNLQLGGSTVSLWEKHLDEPVPDIVPRVKRFQRTLAFLTTPRPMVIVYDHLETHGPASFDWLLHAANRMETDESSGSITIRAGEARLAVRLLANVPFGFSQFSQFPVPPEGRYEKAPDQWHLAAHTQGTVDTAKFIAIMIPYHANEPAPKIDRIDRPGTAGFRIGGTEIVAWWGAGETGLIDVTKEEAQGRLGVKIDDGSEVRSLISR